MTTVNDPMIENRYKYVGDNWDIITPATRDPIGTKACDKTAITELTLPNCLGSAFFWNIKFIGTLNIITIKPVKKSVTSKPMSVMLIDSWFW